MGEGIIARGGGSSSGAKFEYKLMTEIIIQNTNWTVPNNIKNGEISVFLFGGGGGLYANRDDDESVGGGGGGWMNKSTISLAAGVVVPITIGAGGINSSGGTTAFGTYFSANGGSVSSQGFGGSGGAGGGSVYGNAGTGYQFGGGGAAGTMSSWSWDYSPGGNGGEYGGGGGSTFCIGVAYSNYNTSNNYANILCAHSTGGMGNSGYIEGVNKGNIYGFKDSTNGENRTNNTSDIIYCDPISTAGVAGNSFIANKWTNIKNYANYIYAYGFGGGGGYGGNGGNGSYVQNGWGIWTVGGGGGGYYADGGNGYAQLGGGYTQIGGGGGGGYGNNGHDGYAYYQSRNVRYGAGGGGGGYGPSGYGHGATLGVMNNGKSGICILRYYQLTAT